LTHNETARMSLSLDSHGGGGYFAKKNSMPLRRLTTLFFSLIVSLTAVAQPAPLKWTQRQLTDLPIDAARSNTPRTTPNELLLKLKPTTSKKTLDAFELSLSSKTSGQVRLGKTVLQNVVLRSLSPTSSSERVGLKTKTPTGIERIYALRFDQAVSIDQAAQALSQNPDVEYVQRNHLYQLDGGDALNTAARQRINDWSVPNDSAYASQWNLQTIRAEGAWRTTKGSPTVKIGIVDTGIDYTHPDLIPNLFINAAEDRNRNGTFEPWDARERRNKQTFLLDPNGITGDFDGIDQDNNGYADDVIGWDFVDQPFNVDALGSGFSDFRDADPDPFDDNFHGTACAGIAAATTNNKIGIAGIAPNCKLVALRVFSAFGGYGGDVASDKDIASALIYAADNGIRVLNMSFGDVVLSPVMRDAVQYAYSKGVVMCASAGNAGGFEQRYPAGYDEVIATAATTRFDDVTQFSTRGIRVDLAAPGEGIVTTYPFFRNFYTGAFGGTSAAAAHSSGAAALVLSRYPTYTPEQVRGVLVSTADDIDDSGWDAATGGGRLNLERALESIGTPIAKILSPNYDTGIFPTTTARVAIIGTATSPQFQNYDVQFRAGLRDGGAWQSVQTSTRQRINDTLAVWNVAALADTEYVVRLLVREQNGRTVENRVRYILDRTPPRLSNVAAGDVIINDQRGILIEGATDDLAEATLFFKPKNTGAFQPLRLPFVRKTHFQLLTRNDLQPNIEYEAYLEAKNLAGLTTRSQTITFTLNGEIFQPPTFGQTLFRNREDLRLPVGYFFKDPQDFNRNGRREVVMNEGLPLQGLKFGSLKRFEYNGSRFILLDSFPQPYIPRSIADLDADGRLELLAQSGGRTILFGQSAPTASPFSQLRFADTTSRNFWGAAIADTKGNGERQLIARNDTAYFIVNRAFQRTATLPNPVRRAKDGTRPAFEEPKVIVEDFDGDRNPELLFGDFDGNFIIYEYAGVGDAYNQTWLNRTPYIGGNFVLSGNFCNNGKRQFLTAAHADLNSNSLRDYDVPVWFVQIWQASGDNQYEKVWEQRFYNYRAKTAFESAMTNGDVDRDGVDELLILAYPNLYVFKWNQAERTFKPFWIFPAATAQELMVADVDGNGLNEIYFSDDLRSYAFEFQNSRLPLAPVGVAIEPLGTAAVQLSWNRNNDAREYRLYRGDYANFPSYPFRLSFRASTGDTVFIDRQVQQNRVYVYAVTAWNGSLESDTSAYLFGVPKRLPQLSSAQYDADENLRLSFSDQLQDTPLNAAWFEIQKLGQTSIRFPTSAILARGARDVVLPFRMAPLDTGRYTVRVSNVRDVFGARLDSNARAATFTVSRTAQQPFFITERRLISPRDVEITLNKSIDGASARVLSNYDVKPSGRVSSVSMNEAQNKLRLTIDGRPIGALGVTVSLILKNLRSADGSVIDTVSGGNVASFSEFKNDLSEVFTYPNPYRKNEAAFVTFANLTRRAVIEIFTLNGRVIKRIEHDGETGGARWALDTDNGEQVASGIYLYRVTADGVPEKIGKLAVVR